MKPWRKGDPVGSGEVYLPDSKSKQAYAEACKSLWLEPAAQHAVNLPTLHARRQFLASYPNAAREELKIKILELWDRKNEQKTTGRSGSP